MLTKGLIKNNYDVYIITFPKNFQDNELKNDFQKIGCSIFEHQRKWYTLLNNIISLNKIAKKIDPMVVHSHLLFADVLSAVTCSSVKKVSTLRSIPTEELKMSFGSLRGLMLAKLHILSIRLIDCPVACSRSVQLFYSNHKIDVGMIYNAISSNKTQKKNFKTEHERIIKEHNISENSIVGLMVGSLCHRKNPIFAINIMMELIKKHQNLLFFVLGDGPLIEYCADMCQDTQKIIFVGFSDEVSVFYDLSNFIVSCSESEGLPNSLLEAIGEDLYLFVSDISQHQEIHQFCDYGSNLLPFERELKSVATEEWCNKIHHWIATGEHKKAPSFQRALDRFSSDLMVQKYMMCYNQIVKN